MKKISNILVVLMLMVSLASVVLADEEAEENETEESDENYVDSETQEEIEIMINSLGAEIRLLQLEKAILKNILKGRQTKTA